MASIIGLSDAQTLEQYGVSLDNTSSNSTISQLLGELSYDQDTIVEGQNRLKKLEQLAKPTTKKITRALKPITSFPHFEMRSKRDTTNTGKSQSNISKRSDQIG